MIMFTLQNFYTSKKWASFRDLVIDERIKEDGLIYDEVTNQPILQRYDIILHHVIPLTEDNVNDYNVSLNPYNIQVVSHKTHNMIHGKLNDSQRYIYLVYGAPYSGKTTYVDSVREAGDLIVDINLMWQCVSGLAPYEKPGRLNAIVFGIRDFLLESVRTRRGKWRNAYVVGGYPLSSDRERLCRMLGAREIYIDTPEDICRKRLEADESNPHKDEYQKYITDWFTWYRPSINL